MRGDRARWVEMAVTNARHGAELRYQSSASYDRQLEALADALDLGEPPARLECFDVSHTGGEATVASCVVFGPEGPLKSDYRRFNVTDVQPGDDYGAMEQVLRRRYARVKQGEVALPDVLFVDGGPGQLAQAVKVMDDLQIQGLKIVGVAKGLDRKPGRESLYLPDRAEPLRLPAELAGITLDPAAARRGARFRDHGASRAAAASAARSRRSRIFRGLGAEEAARAPEASSAGCRR